MIMDYNFAFNEKPSVKCVACNYTLCIVDKTCSVHANSPVPDSKYQSRL